MDELCNGAVHLGADQFRNLQSKINSEMCSISRAEPMHSQQFLQEDMLCYMGHCSFWRVQLFSPRSAQERTVKITNGVAAVLADGSVVAWGHPAFGGECSAVQDQLRNVHHLQSTPSAFAAILANGSVVTSVQQVQATESAFAAILANGSVVTWGAAYDGGDSSSVQHLLKDVKQIQRSNVAFAAILGDGSVVTWGVPIYGDSSAVQDQLRDVQ